MIKKIKICTLSLILSINLFAPVPNTKQQLNKEPLIDVPLESVLLELLNKFDTLIYNECEPKDSGPPTLHKKF